MKEINKSQKSVNQIPNYISAFFQKGKDILGSNVLRIGQLVYTNSYSSYIINLKENFQIAILGFDGLHNDFDRDLALRSLLDSRYKTISEENHRNMPLVVLQGPQAHFIEGMAGTEKGLIQRQMIDIIRIMYPNHLGETLRLALSPMSKQRFWPVFMPKTIVKGLDKKMLSREISSIYKYNASKDGFENIWCQLKDYFTYESSIDDI